MNFLNCAWSIIAINNKKRRDSGNCSNVSVFVLSSLLKYSYRFSTILQISPIKPSDGKRNEDGCTIVLVADHVCIRLSPGGGGLGRDGPNLFAQFLYIGTRVPLPSLFVLFLLWYGSYQFENCEWSRKWSFVWGGKVRFVKVRFVLDLRKLRYPDAHSNMFQASH